MDHHWKDHAYRRHDYNKQIDDDDEWYLLQANSTASANNRTSAPMTISVWW